jgi:hypothetical protein
MSNNALADELDSRKAIDASCVGTFPLSAVASEDLAAVAEAFVARDAFDTPV